MTASPRRWSKSDQKAIREELDRILNSGPFQQSHRRQQFLSISSMKLLPGAATG